MKPIVWMGGEIADTVTSSLVQYDGTAIPVFLSEDDAQEFVDDHWATKWYSADFVEDEPVLGAATGRLTRYRLPESALNLTRLAKDLTALRDAMAAAPSSFANVWPEDTAAVRLALSRCLNDIEAALDAADDLMAGASLVANVVPAVSGASDAAAFHRFKILADIVPVLTDMYSFLTRMQSNVLMGDAGCSDATYPVATAAIDQIRTGSIYDLES